MAGDAPTIAAAFAAVGWTKPVELFEQHAREDLQELRSCCIAEVAAEIAGYGTIQWEASYAAFRDAGIPEISDLNALPAFRNLGVGSRLMDALKMVPVAGPRRSA